MFFNFTSYLQNGEFVKCLPFSDENPLCEKALSDHSSIVTKVAGLMISSINLNNIWYAPNFELGRQETILDPVRGAGPFYKTPLYRKGQKEASSQEWQESKIYMARKHAQQAQEVYNNLVKKNHDLIYLDECFPAFLEELKKKLQELIDSKSISLICSWDNLPPEQKKKEYNLSVMIINHRQVVIHQTSLEILKTAYKEIVLPLALLNHNGQKIIAIATHVPGNAEQFPEEGLKSLAKMANHQLEIHPEAIVIMAGDCNTVPSRLQSVFQTNLKANLSSKILPPPYYTHINPFGYAAKYDMSIVSYSKEKNVDCETLPQEFLPESCQALIQSIDQAMTKTQSK